MVSEITGKLIEAIEKRHRQRKLSRMRNRFLQLGENTELQSGCYQYPDRIQIGRDCYVGSDCRLFGYAGITIGDGTIVSSRCTIHTTNHNFEHAELVPYDGGILLRPVAIGSHVWIGDNVMICPGVSIGDGAVVGMGSVVTKDVSSFMIVGGNPATVIRERSDKATFRQRASSGDVYMAAKRRNQVRRRDITSAEKVPS